MCLSRTTPVVQLRQIRVPYCCTWYRRQKENAGKKGCQTSDSDQKIVSSASSTAYLIGTARAFHEKRVWRTAYFLLKSLHVSQAMQGYIFCRPLWIPLELLFLPRRSILEPTRSMQRARKAKYEDCRRQTGYIYWSGMDNAAAWKMLARHLPFLTKPQSFNLPDEKEKNQRGKTL